MNADQLNFARRACTSNGYLLGEPKAKGCMSAVESFIKRADELPRFICGESPADFDRRMQRQWKGFRKAVLQDVADEHGIPRWKLALYISCGTVVYLLGGVLALVLVGAEAGLFHCYEEWMAHHEKTAAVCGLSPTGGRV